MASDPVPHRDGGLTLWCLSSRVVDGLWRLLVLNPRPVTVTGGQGSAVLVHTHFGNFFPWQTSVF